MGEKTKSATRAETARQLGFALPLDAPDRGPLTGTPLAEARTETRDLVPTELMRRGARVDVVEAYRTVVPEDAAARSREILGGRRRPER